MTDRCSMPPKVGDEIESWCSGTEDNIATILAVEPYTGRYPQWFTYVVRFTALNTQRGWMETVV